MRKINYMVLFVILLFIMTGCERNRTSDNENTSDTTASDTSRSGTVESGVQYKITFNETELAPDTIKLQTGICYQLDFENNGNSEAEFIAGKDLSDKGFDENFFEGLSVENIINEKEIDTEEEGSVTGIKLKPGEKGSLAFTPDESKKGQWLTAVKRKVKQAPGTVSLL